MVGSRIDNQAFNALADWLFRLIVDGNGWSSRFSRLLMSGSVVIKHTLFPEWHHVRQVIANLFPC